MVKPSQQIKATFSKRFKDKVNTTSLNRAANMMGAKAIQLNRERLSMGLDTNGRRIRKLSRSYSKFKRNYILNRLSAKALRRIDTSTDFKAKGVPNYGRLTGQLFSDMSFSVTRAGAAFKQGIILEVRYYILKRSAWKIAALAKMKRLYFGLAKAQSNRGKKERKEIKEVVHKAFGFDAGGRMAVK